MSQNNQLRHCEKRNWQ